MEARTIPFVVLSLLYLWPLIAEVFSGATKVRAGKPARWEGFLNVFVLPFVVITAAVARPALAWMPPWYVVLVVAVIVDGLGFLAWWAACSFASKAAAEGPGPG